MVSIVDPVVKAGIVAALLAAVSSAAERQAGLRGTDATEAHAALPKLPSHCPAGTLPDARVCIPVPAGSGGEELASDENTHRERSGAWRTYEHLPRRPERPEDYRRYRYPVEVLANQNLNASGYDLDRPNTEQRRGEHLAAVGHGGIDLAQRRGAEVRLVALEHQVGDADVVHVGPLFGNSIVTRHAVRESERLREYIVIFGHLEGPAPGLGKGSSVREGSLVGFVGDSGSPGDVHLHLEVRRVRDGVDVRALPPNKLTRNAYTVVCDPRNVLPLGE